MWRVENDRASCAHGYREDQPPDEGINSGQGERVWIPAGSLGERAGKRADLLHRRGGARCEQQVFFTDAQRHWHRGAQEGVFCKHHAP